MNRIRIGVAIKTGGKLGLLISSASHVKTVSG